MSFIITRDFTDEKGSDTYAVGRYSSDLSEGEAKKLRKAGVKFRLCFDLDEDERKRGLSGTAYHGRASDLEEDTLYEAFSWGAYYAGTARLDVRNEAGEWVAEIA